jgi:hypothetical protein
MDVFTLREAVARRATSENPYLEELRPVVVLGPAEWPRAGG